MASNLRTKLTVSIVLAYLIIGALSDVSNSEPDETDPVIEEDRDNTGTDFEDDPENFRYDNLESKGVTEFYETTTEIGNIPEALGLKHKIEEDSENEPNVTATTDDSNEVTMSMVEYVYKPTDGVNSNMDETIESTTFPTTRLMEDPESLTKSPALVDLETGGQRNPKTENSVPEPDKRNYDGKLRPQPAINKSSTLKSWLEDSWLRPPAGILVPLRPMALNRALDVWNDLTIGGLNVSDIVIVGFDSNGVNWRSRHSLQPSSSGVGERSVAEALSKLLVKYQGVHSDASSDATMRALASAAKLVPYDSALFVVTDKGPGDPQRLPLALRVLVEKRLKVYTIWTDPSHPSPQSEAALQELRNISGHTEGDVLPYSLQVMDVDTASNLASEADLKQWNQLEMAQSRQGRLNSQLRYNRFDTLLVRRGGREAISLGVPVENGVSALRIYIEGAVEHAVLYPPYNGPLIDLLNMSSVAAFSPASKTENLSPRDVYLVFPGAKLDSDTLPVLPTTRPQPEAQSAMVGVWHVSIRCDTCDYRLYVTANSFIHLDVDSGSSDHAILHVMGELASVRETQLIDEYGNEIAKLPFNYTQGQHDDNIGVTEVVAKVALPSIKGSKAYIKIVGRDLQGEPFARLCGPLNQPEVRLERSASITFPDSSNDLERLEEENSKIYSQLRYNDSNVLPYNRAISQVVNQRGSLLTAVQIGLSTRLYGAPGDNLQLHFEVTNYREQEVAFRFGAVGELRFLTGISPVSQTIASGQTANVIVSLTISSTAQPGARDLVTFTAYGLEQVSISAYVYVINQGETSLDTWAPELRHNFQGSCIGRTGSDCAEHVWSATIIARDALGGLLRLSSSPAGLMYDSNFISGSREEVVATYRATCCAPRVVINAVDAYGNANSYVIDISYYFSEAAIAAIVLGIFLAILLIALVIFLIYLCVKKRRESQELPYSTSSRNIS